MKSLRLRSSELKWVLCIILFQSFIDLIFIELEQNILVLVLETLTGQKHPEDCWLVYQKQPDSCLE